ncbi:glycosyltransferase [Ulvibacter litoralis]|uniref:N-acetylgalactosamine-N,N'-diacetylbacillosaminyl-diphospho-undecaprenol 4-alpha-N-acetylgalactosaminyltransferase n=1 Tax=Ulvibacter litoralis TaxID=227084 RepID=A0A1G7IMP0_9FLAO|nr:glycosyltransferase [Ulvibacter litoralis]GHC61370.1 glycosyl transferase [Ulvibacter litoralis]SDF13961.1 N-acetylgalactosamine-N,N'-diacetylbacillosaminyl-diphospho-undecaprenol 4-alpha-N-acetylgalactosaminyltransferase [Ulvibacter litoralis]
MKQPRQKIAFVGDTLGEGGAERVQARLSFYFEAQDIEVHHIIVRDVVTYEYAGTLFNMGLLKDTKNGFSNKYKRLSVFRSYLKEHEFDYIIDFRVKNKTLQEFLIAKWVYTTKYIMSIRSFNTLYYFPKNTFLARNIYKNAYGIVTVSKALEARIKTEYGYQNVETIYNPLLLEQVSEDSKAFVPFDFLYILGIGRMQNDIKQFDHLIEAYDASIAKENGIKLVLIGDGKFKQGLERLVAEKDITDNVVFVSHQTNPFPYFKNALVTALTSRNEGFPNVLIESLACETPVVAYNCESGPSEIIENESNGLLVKNQDISAMASALSRMISDTALYQKCKAQARPSVERFNFETIGKAWLDFLKIDEK